MVSDDLKACRHCKKRHPGCQNESCVHYANIIRVNKKRKREEMEKMEYRQAKQYAVGRMMKRLGM